MIPVISALGRGDRNMVDVILLAVRWSMRREATKVVSRRFVRQIKGVQRIGEVAIGPGRGIGCPHSGQRSEVARRS